MRPSLCPHLSFLPIVLDRVSVVMKRHHDHDSSYKRKHLIGDGLQYQRLSPLSLPWAMAAYRQTWYCRRNWIFYILIHRQQEVNCDTEHGLSTRGHKFHLHSDTLPPTKHTNFNKATPTNSATLCWGAFSFKPPHQFNQKSDAYILLVGWYFTY